MPQTVLLCLNQFLFRRSSRKYYYYWRPIGDPMETHRRPIGDLSDRRHIGDQHTWSVTHGRPIGDTSETNMPDQRPRQSSCFIRDPSETDMPQYIISIYINKQKVYKIRIFKKACRSLMGLPSDMLVFNSSLMGLQWFFDGSPMGLR